MALLDYRGGCKVAWETYDNEPEANAAAERAVVEAQRKAELGYDFGYCYPGEVQHHKAHPVHGECWVVTLP